MPYSQLDDIILKLTDEVTVKVLNVLLATREIIDEDIVNTWLALQDPDEDPDHDWIYFLLEVANPSSALTLSNRTAAVAIDCDRDGDFEEFEDRLITYVADGGYVYIMHGDRDGDVYGSGQVGQIVGNMVEWGGEVDILAQFPDQPTSADYCQDITDNVRFATASYVSLSEIEIIDQTEGEVFNADFSAVPVTGAAPLLVNFTNLSSGEFTTCDWDFGDGNTSTDCNDPDNTYATPGFYTVSLTIGDGVEEDTETKTSYISVYEQAVADFSGTPTSGIASLLVGFENLSTGDYDTCDWNFGDGGTSSVCVDPDHNYNSGGVYTVSLTINGGGGMDTETKTGYITVYDPAQADFSASPQEGVAPLLVNFTNLSTGDYDTCSWTYGDGGTSSDCNDPGHTYNTAGVYTVSLTVNGDGGQDTETKTGYISVFVQAEAEFSATPTTGIVPLLVGFTNSSTGDYDTCEWDFGDGGTSSECVDPDHTYDVGGTYTVSLTVSGDGGEDTETKTDYLVLYDPAVADFSASPTAGASPLFVSFTNLSTGDYAACE